MERLTKLWPDGVYTYVSDSYPCSECFGKDADECDECFQTKVINRLAAYEDIGTPDEITATLAELKAYKDAEEQGLMVRLPIVAMIEQTLIKGEFSQRQKDRGYYGRYAVVYSDKSKWSSPLIDICGDTPYRADEAVERAAILTRAEAEAAIGDNTGGCL